MVQRVIGAVRAAGVAREDIQTDGGGSDVQGGRTSVTASIAVTFAVLAQ